MTRRYLIARDVTAYGILPAVTILCVAFWGGLTLSGCTNLHGQDTTRHTDNSSGVWTATTQRSDAGTTVHYASTQSSGGAVYTADSGVTIDVTPRQVRIETVDHASATTQPAVVTVDRGTSDVRSKLNTDVRGTVVAAVDDETTVGPSFSGPGANALAVDAKGNLTAKTLESTLKRRWPVVAGLAIIGAIFFLLPPPKGSTVAAIGFLGAAAASLVLSDFWFLCVCAVAVFIPLWPHLKASGLLTRLAGQLHDWKSDMPAIERQHFDSTLAIAGGADKKLLDLTTVQAVNSGVVVPVAPVPPVGP